MGSGREYHQLWLQFREAILQEDPDGKTKEPAQHVARSSGEAAG